VKRIVFIASVIALLLIANGLVRSIFDLLHKEDILTQAQKQLEMEKIKNLRLNFPMSRPTNLSKKRHITSFFW
jgi:hypothetical protein